VAGRRKHGKRSVARASAFTASASLPVAADAGSEQTRAPPEEGSSEPPDGGVAIEEEKDA